MRILLISSILLSSYALADMRPFASNIATKSIQFKLESRSLESEGLFDRVGNYTKFNANNKFSRLESDLSIGYAFSPLFQLDGIIGVRENKTRYVNSVNSQIVEQDKFGIYKLALRGAMALRREGMFRFGLEGLVWYRPITHKTYVASNPHLVLGDKGSYVHLATNWSLVSQSEETSLNLKLGYANAGSNISDYSFWDTRFQIRFGYFGFFLGNQGRLSSNNDNYTSNRSNKPEIGTGATQLYDSINPEDYSYYGGIQVGDLESFYVEASYRTVTAGETTDKYDEFLVSLVYRTSPFASTRNDLFKTYSIEAGINKVSPNGKVLEIDAGLTSGIKANRVVDIFDKRITGRNDLVARGVVSSVNTDTAIINVTKFYKNKKINTSFVVRYGSN